MTPMVVAVHSVAMCCKQLGKLLVSYAGFAHAMRDLHDGTNGMVRLRRPLIYKTCMPCVFSIVNVSVCISGLTPPQNEWFISILYTLFTEDMNEEP